ncbi:MAG: Transcriptional regulator, ArsR family / Ligand-binding SRPBCC domain protein family [uncultured Acidimicrobiales bacterium]|uniref:Transcriptional regulator, ArsR family / Ligand-binding SRPBCC domain protein family n=1 Tax=uncultured Acidimicrobiales bacterium TaxID=310071 RepID=A0A6J4IGN7_9ACTN|nr:MAG: Transcriptional regulator, ArsR family / Ligand-binding SRPBCC domain protein family [uncultured Acidimicrobiales bacterium]
MEKVFEIYIRTTPERLWEAITDSEIRSKYSFGNRISSDWTPGSRFEMTNQNADAPLREGENLEVDPPRRLVQTMRASGLKTWLETGQLLTTPGSLMYT